MRVWAVLRTHGRVASLALGPAAAVIGARLLLPVASPATANAKFSSAATNIDVTPLSLQTMTPDQAKLVEVMNSKASLPFQRSPVVARLLEMPAEDPPPAFEPAAAPAPGEPAAPDCQLTSIFVARGEPTAVLGGNMVRVGDAIGAGWTVGAIDAQAGTVLARHSGGWARTYSLRP